MVRKTTTILPEAIPKEIYLSALVDTMKHIPEVHHVHDLHIWSITSGMDTLSAHIQAVNVPLNACLPLRRGNSVSQADAAKGKDRK